MPTANDSGSSAPPTGNKPIALAEDDPDAVELASVYELAAFRQRPH